MSTSRLRNRSLTETDNAAGVPGDGEYEYDPPEHPNPTATSQCSLQKKSKIKAVNNNQIVMPINLNRSEGRVGPRCEIWKIRGQNGEELIRVVKLHLS